MRIFEVNNDKFINLDKVFKFELCSMEDSDSVFWKFYSGDDANVASKEFVDKMDAVNWLSMTITRADAANEIISSI